MNQADDGLECHRGGCLCPTHELRITRRCLTEDLGLAADTSFADACHHPIVQAFRTRRRDQPYPSGGDTVGPWAGADTLYTLRYTDDHRGVTWFDEEHDVAWLCAYGLHRSGDADDAFQRFEQLLKADDIYPDESDIGSLLRDRRRRFNEVSRKQAKAASAVAAHSPNTVIECTLGHSLPPSQLLKVRVIAEEVSGDIAVISIAFSPARLNQQGILFVIACFAPDNVTYDVCDDLAGLPLSSDEIAFRLLAYV